MWTLDEALTLIRKLNPLALKNGFSIALGGSVLHEGSSEKDLDLIVIPLNGECYDINKFRGMLEHSAGWERKAAPYLVKIQWFKHSRSTDSKNVEIWRTPSGNRVDIFYVS